MSFDFNEHIDNDNALLDINCPVYKLTIICLYNSIPFCTSPTWDGSVNKRRQCFYEFTKTVMKTDQKSVVDLFFSEITNIIYDLKQNNAHIEIQGCIIDAEFEPNNHIDDIVIDVSTPILNHVDAIYFANFKHINTFCIEDTQFARESNVYIKNIQCVKSNINKLIIDNSLYNIFHYRKTEFNSTTVFYPRFQRYYKYQGFPAEYKNKDYMYYGVMKNYIDFQTDILDN